MDRIAIKVENLNKVYRIYNKPIDRIKESLSPFKKRYHKEYYALRDITFEIKKGETLGIIGKNGCGKSTLLKIITGVLSPTNGSVQVNGKISALLELGAGFNPEYTGMQNIYLNGTIMGYKKEQIDKKLNEIIEFADIGEFINQPVKTYSSGMFARLAFAVAINVEPDILIVDEILSVGDMYFQAKCMTKMKEMFSGGVTVIFVTHDTNSVKNLCQKALYLKDGQIVKFGLSEEIVDMYAKDARQEMIEQNLKFNEKGSIEKVFPIENAKISSLDFKESEELQKRVKSYRQGTGDVILTQIELLNSEDENIENVKFNEEVRIRMYVKFNNDSIVSVGYHIRDNNNIEILGSNTLLENYGEIKGTKGERLIVDFITKIPLIEGKYNISTVISTMTVHNRAAIFADYTENAYIFNVEENMECKVWNKVYVKNNIRLYRIQKEVIK